MGVLFAGLIMSTTDWSSTILIRQTRPQAPHSFTGESTAVNPSEWISISTAFRPPQLGHFMPASFILLAHTTETASPAYHRSIAANQPTASLNSTKLYRPLCRKVGSPVTASVKLDPPRKEIPADRPSAYLPCEGCGRSSLLSCRTRRQRQNRARQGIFSGPGDRYSWY
ncbi:MAG: hypothetical protein FD174_1901 [Geobacteraceae bacterium]|nr:MAG: hypothetical protein FD174_1901 [Geobacteraceae bacterium]